MQKIKLSVGNGKFVSPKKYEKLKIYGFKGGNHIENSFFFEMQFFYRDSCFYRFQNRFAII